MLLTLYTLPQLAVSATIFFCLLMVVNCGAAPSSVRSARLYSKCSRGYVRIYPNGTVIARGSDPGDKYHNLTISTENWHLKLLIFAPEVKRYLCYNQKWKLVGLKISKQKALNRMRCQFYENMTEQGYNSYESVQQKGRFITFNLSGEQPRPRHIIKAENAKMRDCRNFLKDTKSAFDIGEHNNKVAEAAGAELRAIQHRPHQDHARRPRIQADKHRHPKSRARNKYNKYNDYETTWSAGNLRQPLVAL